MPQNDKALKSRLEFNEESLKYLTELLEITTKMLSAFNLDKLLKQILDTSIDFLKADTGSVMLVDENAQDLKIKVARGLNEQVVENVSIKIGEKVAGWVAKEGKPLLLIGDLKNDPRFSHLDGKKEIKSAISVPLKVENRVIGVLNLNNVYSEFPFSESDLKVLSLLANQAAISIWNVKLYEDARKANKELLETQQQLIAREKMVALGQLSTGIAHEVNNPLTVIIGNVQYLMENMSKNSYGWTELKEIKEAAELCSRIIERLFNYCRPANYNQEPVDVSDIAKKVTELVDNQFIKQNVKINLDLAPSLPKVVINPDELKEIFLNIMLNAKSAMSAGGTLTIATKDMKSDGAIDIIFSDTGCGIPKEIIDKIFDPFFTTKRPVSTGLGLSICQRIVSNYKGSIKVESEPGKGTTFIIRFPAIAVK